MGQRPMITSIRNVALKGRQLYLLNSLTIDLSAHKKVDFEEIKHYYSKEYEFNRNNTQK